MYSKACNYKLLFADGQTSALPLMKGDYQGNSIQIE